MSLKKFLMAGIVAAVLVACGDDDSSFATRPSGDSSSACEDCDGSSSSKAKSSSSSAKSSSSSSVPEGYVDPSTVVKGTMTDERDGQTYKTVTIGTQTWMAENLNFAYTDVPYKYEGYVVPVSSSDSTSWCYNDFVEYCTKYGRLYTWSAAMDSVGTWSANGKDCGYGTTCSPTYPVRGICPEGWHLPTKAEFETLFTAVGGSSTAGKMLKSTSGWNSSEKGTDAYSFSALPAGYRDYFGDYSLEGSDADFWSSTEGAYYGNLHFINGDASLVNHKAYGFSVRCLKDEGEAVESSSSVTSQSSSSSTSVSSSSKVPELAEGTLTDTRDGTTYKTVTIGTQTWMAENLNYKTVDSYCYKGAASNCTKYGRLYTWAAAMDSMGTWSANGKGCGYIKTCSPTYPVRGVCPEGWRLPTKAEFETLFTAVGGFSTAGKMLKSTSGWNSSGNGTDAYAFSALPAGIRVYDGDFNYEGYYAYFWSSTEDGSSHAYSMYLDCYNGIADLNLNYKHSGFSVRCLKDLQAE